MYRLTIAVLSVVPAVMAGQIGFVQTNLASDVPGLAKSTDPDLVNAWGMGASAGSPVWMETTVPEHRCSITAPASSWGWS